MEGAGVSAEAFPRESRCRSCRAPIVWLLTVNGKRMPVNADTVRDEDVQFEAGRHVSHFATCEHSDQWRRPK